MPAHDYRAPAISSARELTFWSRFNRAVALVLAFLTIAMLVTAVAELNESSPDSTLLLGGLVGGPPANGPVHLSLAEPADGTIMPSCGCAPR